MLTGIKHSLLHDYAPISVKPNGGGGALWGGGVGVEHRVGILAFPKKGYQNPNPRVKKNCQN